VRILFGAGRGGRCTDSSPRWCRELNKIADDRREALDLLLLKGIEEKSPVAMYLQGRRLMETGGEDAMSHNQEGPSSFARSCSDRTTACRPRC
jgi:hypothetical protein